jgi:hypothetical protein
MRLHLETVSYIPLGFAEIRGHRPHSFQTVSSLTVSMALIAWKSFTTCSLH